jgi:AraC-like DNA-binding protein
MPRTATFLFDDPIPYQAAIRAGDIDLLLTSRGKFRAELTQIDCDRLWMQYGSDNLPGVMQAAVTVKRVVVVFHPDPTRSPPQFCGMEMTPQTLAVSHFGSLFHIRSGDSIRWSAMSLPPDDLSRASLVLLGRELDVGSAMRFARAHPAQMARLIRLHGAARGLVYSAPEFFLRTEVYSVLEHELVHAMVTCLANDNQAANEPTAWRQHTAIIRRFEEFLAANSDRPLHLTEICRATGAAERTLRYSCEEQLGMSPVRYLWLRRLHLARAALIHADPAITTVTEIATHFGFWQLGRFAVSYRGLFGESPAATLHRPSSDLGPLEKTVILPKLNSQRLWHPQ